MMKTRVPWNVEYRYEAVMPYEVNAGTGIAVSSLGIQSYLEPNTF